MSQENISISFIGQKVGKLCWCVNCDGSLSNDQFVTGGWDERNENYLTLWRFPEDNMDSASEPYIITHSIVKDGMFNNCSLREMYFKDFFAHTKFFSVDCIIVVEIFAFS